MSKEEAKDKLIEILTNQVVDLSMMSKIELGEAFCVRCGNQLDDEILLCHTCVDGAVDALMEKEKNDDWIQEFKKGQE